MIYHKTADLSLPVLLQHDDARLCSIIPGKPTFIVIKHLNGVAISFSFPSFFFSATANLRNMPKSRSYFHAVQESNINCIYDAAEMHYFADTDPSFADTDPNFADTDPSFADTDPSLALKQLPLKSMWSCICEHSGSQAFDQQTCNLCCHERGAALAKLLQLLLRMLAPVDQGKRQQQTALRTKAKSAGVKRQGDSPSCRSMASKLCRYSWVRASSAEQRRAGSKASRRLSRCTAASPAFPRCLHHYGQSLPPQICACLLHPLPKVSDHVYL